ncbi:hypothetical protein IEO70_07595 [Bacillus sp. AGMB 02131]|uniref:SCP2 domain-containing protein n=1 Tax=Peribacillus faecalis TaxID=2772559 RepID=A0A927CUU9_9BACI|nr:hypothetical protein [Peribacillus faecalis]MBD3108228.1 hypothetical protein [Peribacillus faecalis]
MIKELQSVLANIQNHTQLQVLLKKTNTSIVFLSEKEQWHLFLSERLSHAKKTDKSSHQIIITGSKQCIEEALTGRFPLRKLQKLGQLEIKGNFRQILLIEAILLLCREKSAV